MFKHFVYKHDDTKGSGIVVQLTNTGRIIFPPFFVQDKAVTDGMGMKLMWTPETKRLAVQLVKDEDDSLPIHIDPSDGGLPSASVMAKDFFQSQNIKRAQINIVYDFDTVDPKELLPSKVG